MIISKMYKLETIAQICKSKYGINDFHEFCNIFNVSSGPITVINLKGLESLDYIQGALAIPYPEALELINHYKRTGYYKNYDMWSNSLSREYNLPPNVVIQRFDCVNRLSKSLIYRKKIEELYSSDSINKILKWLKVI